MENKKGSAAKPPTTGGKPKKQKSPRFVLTKGEKSKPKC
jgi:hypothetical protein